MKQLSPIQRIVIESTLIYFGVHINLKDHVKRQRDQQIIADRYGGDYSIERLRIKYGLSYPALREVINRADRMATKRFIEFKLDALYDRDITGSKGQSLMNLYPKRKHVTK